jgi:hypothetical protein
MSNLITFWKSLNMKLTRYFPGKSTFMIHWHIQILFSLHFSSCNKLRRTLCERDSGLAQIELGGVLFFALKSIMAKIFVHNGLPIANHLGQFHSKSIQKSMGIESNPLCCYCCSLKSVTGPRPVQFISGLVFANA